MARDLPSMRDAWSILGEVSGERRSRVVAVSTPSGAGHVDRLWRQQTPAAAPPGVVRGRAE